MSAGERVRVLHVNDCAFTVANLMRVARARGLPWGYLPLAASGATWTGVGGQVLRAALGTEWLGRLALASRRADLRHVHFATVANHTRLVPQRYVLHAHGSDVRTLQYEPRYGGMIRRALGRAEAVCYSTPDLAEHTLPHRPDAIYLPVPIDVAGAPAWLAPDQRPHWHRPRVVFSSRWDGSKGLDAQLAIAAQVVRAMGDKVDVVGLDWGPGAAAARDAGVHLLARRDHPAYLQLLAEATVVVGQSSGILAASELEALAIGAPLVMTARHGLYGAEPPPVLDLAQHGPDDVVAAVTDALADPAGFAERQQGRAWVGAHHDAELGVDRLVDLYATLV